VNKKKAIKRFLLTLMWLGVAGGMGVIITAAIRVQEAGVCKGYQIKIDGFNPNELFTSEEHIVSLLKAATKGDIQGQKKSDINLPVIEDLLEQSAWVYNADLYFDNNNVLHAMVTERKPLARVFASNGNSFYIDEAGKQIPLSEKVSLDLPVFTGYPDKKVLSVADSSMIQNVIATASFIKSDPFWNAQVAQIDITSCGKDCWNMEMIPVVGNHKVELGDGSDISTKFHRLMLFYDQVLKRTGFDKYQKIDVQYEGQIVGVKGNYTKIDSIQLRKNIENLLRDSRKSNELLLLAPKNLSYTPDSLAGPNLTADDKENIGDSTQIVNSADEDNELGETKEQATVLSSAVLPVVAKKSPTTKAARVKEAHDTKDTPAKNSKNKEHKEGKKATTETKKVVATSLAKTEVKKPVDLKKTVTKPIARVSNKKVEPVKKETKSATVHSKPVAKPAKKKVENESKSVTKKEVKKPTEKKSASKPVVEKVAKEKKPEPKREVKKIVNKKTTGTAIVKKVSTEPVKKQTDSKKKN